MADAALFIGWGENVPGREAKGIEVFGEALAYYGSLQESGSIEGFDVVLLAPHGGDLAGFLLVKGSDEQLAALRATTEFDRLNTRAGLVVNRLGVVDAVLGAGVGPQIELAQQAIADLA
jgi:hypothetical protein